MPIDIALPFHSRVGFYRGRPVFVLATQVGLAKLGPVRTSRHDLRNIEESLGLRALDRYLTNPKPSAGCQVIVTEGCAYVETGTTALLTSPTTYEPDWAVAVLQERKCILLVLLGVAEGDSLDPLIRAASGTRRCVGAVLDVLDATVSLQSGPDRYRLVGPAGIVTPMPSIDTSFVLDSNVMRDLEASASGRLSRQSPPFLAISRLMARLIHQHTVPGFAIAELTSLQANGDRYETRHASLRSAVDAWFDYGMKGVLDTSDLATRWGTRCRDTLEARSDGVKDPNFLLLDIYSALLKLDELWDTVNGYNPTQRTALFVEFCRFISEDLKVVSAHTLHVAFDLLVGDPRERDYVFRLLKFSQRTRMKDLRGAAWDIFFLRVPELATTPGNPLDIPPGNRALLVTADRAIPELRARIVLRGHIDSGNSTRGMLAGAGSLDRRLEMHRATIEGAIECVQAGVRVRTGQTLDDAGIDRITHWTALLEEHLLLRHADGDVAESNH